MLGGMPVQDRENTLRRMAAFGIGLLCITDPWAGISSLPFREVIVLCLAAAAAFPSRRRDLSEVLSGTGWSAVAAVALVTLSGVRSHSTIRALGEPAQLALYIVVLPTLLGAGRVPARPLAWGMCTGTALTVAAAFVLGVLHRHPDGGAMLDNRFLYGVGLAAMLPMVCVLVMGDERLRPWRRACPLVAALAGFTLTSLGPALLCLVAVAWSARWWRRENRGPVLLTVAGWIAGTLVSLCLVNGRAASGSAAFRDEHGAPRRWVQEAVAGVRALTAAPALGHGSGRYQETVSSGAFRGDLPRPAESRVEPGMQSGALVRAVEHGLPAVLAILAVFFLSVSTSLASGDPEGEPWRAAVCPGLLMLGLGMILTPTTTRAGGLFVGAMLSLTHRGRAHAHQRSRGAIQTCTIAAAVATMVLARQWPRAEGPVVPTPSTPWVTIVIEAETATDMAPVVAVLESPRSAAGRVLHLPDGALETAKPDALASWSFSVPDAGPIATWYRVRWRDGCGNSFAVGIDGARPVLVGNDGTYQSWHWVKGPTANVAAGPHALVLQPREDGIWLDQILVTSQTGLRPVGILGPDGRPVPAGGASTPAPVRPNRPPVKRERPFLIGFGGCYRGGFLAALLELGLPWGKVGDSDLTRPERLAPFSVICLSEMKEVDGRRMFPVLEQYVRTGGVLLYENHTGPIPSEYRSNRLFSPTRTPWSLTQRFGAALETDASPIFGDIRPGTTFRLEHDVPFLAQDGEASPEWKGYGLVARRRKHDGAAVWERGLGKGRVFYNRIPMSFHTMWRGPGLLPPLRSLLTELAKDEGGAVAPIPEPSPPAGTADSFSDDFMRAGEEPGPGWTASGEVRCTGERGRNAHTEFCLELCDVARARAGITIATDWALSAAVLPDHGDGGIWVATDGGGLSLVCENVTSVRLDQTHGGRTWTAAEFELPPGGGWHRLSLVSRGDIWEAYVDGLSMARLRHDSGESADMRCGVRSDGGRLFVDDVTVRPSAALVPGTDRCLGDEGSSQSWGGLAHEGIEKRTVYSLQWHTRPSADFCNAVELSLPNYTAGSLVCDGDPLVDVGPNPDGAVVALPDPPQRRNHIGFSCPTWRDFVFRGRQTDWFCTGVDWVPLARWSCDPRWSWLGAETRKRTALWYRHELRPPYAVSAVVSVGARHAFGEEYERGRDVNLALGATGSDPSSALAVKAMNAETTGIEVWHHGKLITRAAGVGLPSGHSLHHNWFEVTAIAEERRLRVRFEGREVLDVPLANPLQPGRAALWTENNSVRVARITLSLSSQDPSAAPIRAPDVPVRPGVP